MHTDRGAGRRSLTRRPRRPARSAGRVTFRLRPKSAAGAGVEVGSLEGVAAGAVCPGACLLTAGDGVELTPVSHVPPAPPPPSYQ